MAAADRIFWPANAAADVPDGHGDDRRILGGCRRLDPDGGYQKLKDIDLTADGRTLRLEFDIVGAASSQKVEVEVAPEVVEVIREFFAKHRAAR